MIPRDVSAQIDMLSRRGKGGMYAAEYCYIYNVLQKRVPCNLLVFGVGNDSLLWHNTNKGGLTVFLEDVKSWTERISTQHPHLSISTVTYNTRRGSYRQLLKEFKAGNNKVLELDMSEDIKNTTWDVIIVDGPQGNSKRSPGRMKSIYASSILGGEKADIFVHDYIRKVEGMYVREFLTNIIHIKTLGHYHPKKKNHNS